MGQPAENNKDKKREIHSLDMGPSLRVQLLQEQMISDLPTRFSSQICTWDGSPGHPLHPGVQTG